MNFSTARSHLFEPLHGQLTRSPKLRYWKELEKTQFLNERQLLDIQWGRVKDLLAFAWENNEFYQNRMKILDLSPESIRCLDDIRKLPILTKEEVRTHTKNMLSRGYDMRDLQKAKTGGSTGKALDLFFTEECSELRNACARRHDCWTGWRPGEPIAACWGNPKIPTSFKEILKANLLQPYIYLDTMHVDENSVRAFAASWLKIRPTLLYGHAHSIFLLSEFIRDLDIFLPAPKGILSTSMMLIPSERKQIEEVFGLKVTDRYGCEEVSLIGSECEMHDGMHLNIEHLLIEFIREDGSPAEDGEQGRIIVTDLMNRAKPFIRYQVEDFGIRSDRKCSCGRGLPLMEQVVGRSADFLIKSDGSKVAGVSLIENTLTKIPGIAQMQIVQESLEEVVIKFVPEGEHKQETTDALMIYFQSLFGDSVVIRNEIVEMIEPEASGKYRFSICRVN